MASAMTPDPTVAMVRFERGDMARSIRSRLRQAIRWRRGRDGSVRVRPPRAHGPHAENCSPLSVVTCAWSARKELPRLSRSPPAHGPHVVGGQPSPGRHLRIVRTLGHP